MLEDDAKRVADAIQHDFPRIEPWHGIPWDAAPPVRVIDCVLSLNRPHKSVVLPRVMRFAAAHGEVQTCRDLLALIERYETPVDFLCRVLNLRDPRRAETLLGVTKYAIDVQQRFDGASELDRLRQWARWARPGDYLAVGVPGFALAGFQYLRMLFGADTAKPDVHIVRYVSDAVGRKVTDVQALYILERAAELARQPLLGVDGAIWRQSAK